MHVLANSSVTASIPPTITDQIRLWEQERDRFTFTEGVLYNQFLSQVIILTNFQLSQYVLYHLSFSSKKMDLVWFSQKPKEVFR